MFKECPKCKKKWKTFEELSKDPFVSFCGHKKNTKDLLEGLALFNHKTFDCNSTFSLKVQKLKDSFFEDDFTDGPNTKIRKISEILSSEKRKERKL